MENKQLILVKRPKGFPEQDNWEYKTEAVAPLEEGQMLVEQQYVSLDPAMRGWMNETRSYIPPIKIGEVMRAGTVGKVIETKGTTRFKKDDYLVGWGGVQQYVITNGEGYQKVASELADLTTYLGVLGLTGLTAYFGILEVAAMKKGEVVLVSGAAGAVGSVVGQIAKIKGCKVIGIAGGKNKCDYLLNELGFDAAIDYKNESLRKEIKRNCPKGIDIYFDNVGGETLDHALASLRINARVVICGAISQYNSQQIEGPKNYLSLLVNRASMKGMVVFDYEAQYDQARIQMSKWMKEGKLKTKEDVYEGIDNFYEVFLKLFSGDKLGKLILKIIK
jgi:NADPH-dependent curcumin reductase CurA